MENGRSYYDWESQFKKKSTQKKPQSEKLEANELNIKPDLLKSFLKAWKEKNL